MIQALHVLLFTLAIAWGCGSRDISNDGDAAVLTTAGEVAQHGEDAGPRRCAAALGLTPASSATTTSYAGFDVDKSPGLLILDDQPRRQLVIAAVADARRGDDATLASMRTLRSVFQDNDVDIVVVLGGMAANRDELQNQFASLANDVHWPIIALPGDRERLSTLRSAIASTPSRVIDGSTHRFIAIGDYLLATLPGCNHPDRLLEGRDGCIYTAADVSLLGTTLGRLPGEKIWLSYVPPGFGDDGASDLVEGGIHVGDDYQAAAMADAEVRLAVHGVVDATENDDGTHPSKKGPMALASGSLDPLPAIERGPSKRGGIATIVTISPTKVSWKRIRASDGQP